MPDVDPLTEFTDPNRQAVNDPRVQDFLGKIGKSEGADYNTLVGGSKINDLSRHPNKVGLVTSAGPSTAFGKYQITGTTDRSKLAKYRDLDYSPENQDLRAVELLRRTGALDAIQRGDIDYAVHLAGREWASLPGSPLPGRKSSAFSQPQDPLTTFTQGKIQAVQPAADPLTNFTQPETPAEPQGRGASMSTATGGMQGGSTPLTSNDAAWHLGMTPDEAKKLTPKALRVLTEAVQDDQRKKTEGQSIAPPSLKYQNDMRKAAGLQPLKFNIATDENKPSPYYAPSATSFSIGEKPQIQVKPRPFTFNQPSDDQIKAGIQSQVASEAAQSEGARPSRLQGGGAAPPSIDVQAETEKRFNDFKAERAKTVDYARLGPRVGARNDPSERASAAIQELLQKYAPGIASIDTPGGIKTDVLRGAVSGLNVVPGPQAAILNRISQPREITPEEKILDPNAEATANLARGIGQASTAFLPFVGAGKLVSAAGVASPVLRDMLTFGLAEAGKQLSQTGKIDPEALAETMATGGVMGKIAGVDPSLKRRLVAYIAPQLAASVAKGEKPDQILQSATQNALFALAGGHEAKEEAPTQTVPNELQGKLRGSEIDSALAAREAAVKSSLQPENIPAMRVASQTQGAQPIDLSQAKYPETKYPENLGVVGPTKPVEGVEEGAKLNRWQHRNFGLVTETVDQSNVAKGRVRVLDVDGNEHIIQRSNGRGEGNQIAVPVREKAVSAQTEDARGEAERNAPFKVIDRRQQPAERPPVKAETTASMPEQPNTVVPVPSESGVSVPQPTINLSEVETRLADRIRERGEVATAEYTDEGMRRVLGSDSGKLQDLVDIGIINKNDEGRYSFNDNIISQASEKRVAGPQEAPKTTETKVVPQTPIEAEPKTSEALAVRPPSEVNPEQPTVVPAREPWQQTQSEWLNRINPENQRIDTKARPTIYAEDMEGMFEGGRVVSRKPIKDGRMLVVRETPDGEVYGQVNGKTVGYATPLSDAELDVTVDPTYQKQGIGARIQQEFYRRNPDFQSGGVTAAGEKSSRATHKLFVEEAIKEGKPIPPEVLADYPDLAKKYAPVEVAAEPQPIETKPSEPQIEGKRSFPETLKATGREGGTDRTYQVVRDQEAIDKADARIKDNPETARQWASGQLDKGSGKEAVATGLRVADNLSNEASRESDPIKAAEKHAQASELYSKLAARLTESGQEVQAASLAQKYSPSGAALEVQRIVEKVKGEKTKPDLRDVKTARDLAEKYQTADARISELEKQIAQLQAGKPVRAPRASSLTPLKAKLDKAAADAAMRIAATKAKMETGELEFRNAGPLPGHIATHLTDYAIIGAAKMAKGGLTFAEWSTEMVKDLGEDIKPHLATIFRTSKKHLDEQRVTAKEESAQRGATRELTKRGVTPTPENIESLRQEKSKLQAERRQARSDLDRHYRELERKEQGHKLDAVLSLTRDSLLSARGVLRIAIGMGGKQVMDFSSRFVKAGPDIARSTMTGGPRTVSAPSFLSTLRTIGGFAERAPSAIKNATQGKPSEVMPNAHGGPTENPYVNLTVGIMQRIYAGKEAFISSWAYPESLENNARVFALNDRADRLTKLGQTNQRTRDYLAGKLSFEGRRNQKLAASLAKQAANYEARNKQIVPSMEKYRAQELANSPSELLHSMALQATDRAVYRQPYESKLAQKLGQIGTDSAGGKIARNIVLPFSKRPANNIADNLFGYTGLRIFGEGYKGIRESINGEFGPARVKSFNDAIGKGATGFAVMAVGAALSKKGMLVSPLDKDKSKAGALDGTALAQSLDALGLHSLASSVKGHYYNISNVPVVGWLLGMGAAYQKDGAANLPKALYRMISEHPLLRSAKDVSDMVEGLRGNKLGEQLSEYAGRQASRLIPAPVKIAAEASDTEERQTKFTGKKADVKENLIAPTEAALPILRRRLPSTGTKGRLSVVNPLYSKPISRRPQGRVIQ